jgi:hypothetical protein
MVVGGCGRQEGAERCGIHDEKERTEDRALWNATGEWSGC